MLSSNRRREMLFRIKIPSLIISNSYATCEFRDCSVVSRCRRRRHHGVAAHVVTQPMPDALACMHVYVCVCVCVYMYVYAYISCSKPARKLRGGMILGQD